jgi:hypothetical protein
MGRHIGVTLLITTGRGVHNPSRLLKTFIYEEVKLERGGRLVYFTPPPPVPIPIKLQPLLFLCVVTTIIGRHTDDGREQVAEELPPAKE